MVFQGLGNVYRDMDAYGRGYMEAVYTRDEQGKRKLHGYYWVPAHTIFEVGGKYKLTQPVNVRPYKYVQVFKDKIYQAFYDDEIVEITLER